MILLLGLMVVMNAQSPHGTSFKMDCAACHTSEGWDIPGEFWSQAQAPADQQRFDHQQTDFALSGRHEVVDCRACHETLVFGAAQSACITCHTDLHQMSVGDDCARCHSTENWLVDQVTELHQVNGFPLLGNHAIVSCKECHTSETALRFDRIGNECANCHLNEYQATTSPGHAAAGFPTDCVACHDPAGPEWFWSAGGANHLFFPLTGGHEINDCAQCHTGNDFSNTPSDCFACHQNDYESTSSPDHQANNFPTDCAACHTTDPGWMATDFTQHDQAYFPIFSGNHKGEWNQCNECHTTSGNFQAFSCIDCHEHNNASKLANEHDEVSGYSFSSQACYSCHPKGEE